MSIDDLEGRHFHEVADMVNDSHDHDELHAAGEILQSDPVYAMTDPYVRRWLEGLAELHDVDRTKAVDITDAMDM